ncbi:hypothetical protein LY78DRAFT_420890 [Colletotrichum sublineola]|nr:hypothetical protein LY78DRAFT_420890 [Colletotrichum sublineola]
MGNRSHDYDLINPTLLIEQVELNATSTTLCGTLPSSPFSSPSPSPVLPLSLSTTRAPSPTPKDTDSTAGQTLLNLFPGWGWRRVVQVDLAISLSTARTPSRTPKETETARLARPC